MEPLDFEVHFKKAFGFTIFAVSFSMMIAMTLLSKSQKVWRMMFEVYNDSVVVLPPAHHYLGYHWTLVEALTDRVLNYFPCIFIIFIFNTLLNFTKSLLVLRLAYIFVYIFT